MNILVTGTAGFIGFHLVKKLSENTRDTIVGIDNINDYYDVELKYDRLAECGINKKDIRDNQSVKSAMYPKYIFRKMDITDDAALDQLFEEYAFDVVVHLAAQAGVRYSLENPRAYIQSNITGFFNVLECSRQHNIKHLIYASSSSVYGMNKEIPFREDQNVDHPVSLYAATKKSDELMAYTYSHLFNLPTTGLRFFTVYGPWGRPDMAPILFTEAISNGQPIKVFNKGNMLRDFTYIDDIVHSMFLLINKGGERTNRPGISPYQLFNIGNSSPVNLLDFIRILEKELDKEAVLNMQPMQPGDVQVTYADTTRLEEYIRYKPATTLETGIARLVEWFRKK